MVGVRTVVVSDLHLSTASEADLLRHAEPRAVLAEHVRGADHVVLLGDSIELREAPLATALAGAEPFFRELGDAVGDARVTIVPGNHDHRLAASLIEARRLEGDGGSLPVDGEMQAPATGPLALLAGWLGRAELRLAYPGIWLRPDVYATHGHYMDLHVTVPTLERLAVGLAERVIGGLPDNARTPDDYEAALSPVYSLAYNLAQGSGRSRRLTGGDASVSFWSQASPNGRRPPLRMRAMTDVAIPAAVALLNLAGLGPLEPDISGPALRRSALKSIGTVCRHLSIDARHVIFGHTHRSGPWPGDDESEWTLPNGGRLTNTGSWVHQPAFLRPPPDRGPYWPGACVTVEDDGPPRLERLLDAVPSALELATGT